MFFGFRFLRKSNCLMEDSKPRYLIKTRPRNDDRQARTLSPFKGKFRSLCHAHGYQGTPENFQPTTSTSTKFLAQGNQRSPQKVANHRKRVTQNLQSISTTRALQVPVVSIRYLDLLSSTKWLFLCENLKPKTSYYFLFFQKTSISIFAS